MTNNSRPQAAPWWARLSPLGMACFVALCVITGTTFLAMRVAVGPHGGWPPFTMAASRFAAAGTAVLLVLRALGRPVMPARQQILPLAAAGLLLCGGGTGLATLASRSAGSGLVSLFFGLGPIIVTGLEAVIAHRRPSSRGLLGMTLGAVGVGVLVLPAGVTVDAGLTNLAALVLGPACYAAGALTVKYRVNKDALWTVIGWQMIAGAIPLAVAAAAAGEPLPAPTAPAWAAWGYLTAVSSVLGFGAYMVALKRLPTPVFMSHTWVIPIIAMMLGCVLLGEPLTWQSIAAGALIVAGLATLVTASGNRPNPPPSSPPSSNCGAPPPAPTPTPTPTPEKMPARASKQARPFSLRLMNALAAPHW
ncbi:putative inner membrane transporter YedA [Gemmata obscuriglobus]|nr:EamA family transporter [Gemmata obscuriglobus]QEG27808.1 putative inner membrane transporter YedA [Gemmata obscuriglobus]VTS05142.1 hypothetical protein : Uncharacterized protein OS=Desulfotomaculum hydrothermale Lam5 = DSM 18033 GN=DESHY_110193 PE=4 SV=1: EamA: EamA [Gemmata obscuriglobus UQM 2246]